MVRSLRFACLAGALGALAGCPQCAPDLVSVGVAQLTVRNVGAMVSLVNADSACGFDSDAVKTAAAVEGAIGSEGKLTFTVTGCVIDLGATAAPVSEDCTGNKTTASGKITVSATREVGGVLTGNPDSPIVPGGPDAVKITLTSVAFENFEVTSSSSDARLNMISGSISAFVAPRLAASDPASASAGACAIATPNVSFTDISYAAGSLAHVTSADNSFDVDIAASKLSAQNGKSGAGDENLLSGEITVFGSAQTLAPQALDPEFDAAKFAEGYACTADLSSPESFTCADLTPRLADGAARLTVKMLGTVAGLIEADTVCGFSSEAVQGAPAVSGATGGDGSLTFTVADCVISFAELTALAADCDDVATTVAGSITVSGTKVVSGHLSGNTATPFIPTTDQPAVVTLSVVVDGFTVGSNADDNALRADSGTLTGVVRPQVFIGSDTGVCSVSSPNAGFDDVTWTDAALLVTSASGSFSIAVDGAALEAANGTSPAGTNELTGQVTIGGVEFPVPSDAAGLNPTFDVAAFDAAWQCAPTLALPPATGAACAASLDGRVATGIAALTARAFGTAVSIVDDDATCGFSSVGVAVVGATFDGAVGDPDVTATFTLPAAGCTFTLPPGFLGPPDCNGDQTAITGTVIVTGTKTVTGWRTGDLAEPIVPSSAQPATFSLSMTFTDFLVVPAGATSTMSVSGTLEGELQPRVGIDGTTGACSIATPNVTFIGLSWVDGAMTLVSDGNTFVETVTASDINAQNGSDGVATNTLAGTITVSGGAQTISAPLDPAFVQADFDATYLCAANGSPVLADDATCNATFLGVLGQGAARLLVKAAATAVSVHDGNPVCGFADATPDTANVAAPTAAPPAPGTLLQTSDVACQSGFASDTQISTDCLGTETHASGAFITAAGTKFINGLFTGANPPFVPTTRDAATLTLGPITFAGWHVQDEDSLGAVASAVTVTSGTASLVVAPVAGRNAAASAGFATDVFTEKTGIAAISDLTMASGELTIVSEGKTFNLTVTDAAIDAFAGAFFDGATVVGANEISGTITVDGSVVTVGGPLSADYDQATFDSTYSCNAALGGDVVPSSAP